MSHRSDTNSLADCRFNMRGCFSLTQDLRKGICMARDYYLQLSSIVPLRTIDGVPNSIWTYTLMWPDQEIRPTRRIPIDFVPRLALTFSSRINIRDPKELPDVTEIQDTQLQKPETGDVQYVFRDVQERVANTLVFCFVAPSAIDTFTAVRLAEQSPRSPLWSDLPFKASLEGGEDASALQQVISGPAISCPPEIACPPEKQPPTPVPSGKPATELMVDVFKFVSLRPPGKPDPDKMARNFIHNTSSAPKLEELSLQIRGYNETAWTLGSTNEIAALLKFSPEDPVAKDYPDLMRLWNFLRKAVPSSETGLSTLVTNFLAQPPVGKTLHQFLQQVSGMDFAATLWNRLHICYILLCDVHTSQLALDIGDLLGGLRTLHVLEFLKTGEKTGEDIHSEGDLKALLYATVVIGDEVIRSLKANHLTADVSRLLAPEVIAAPQEEKAHPYSLLMQDFVDTHQALNQVQNLPMVSRQILDSPQTVERIDEQGAPITRNVQVARRVLQVDEAAFNQLSPSVKTILQRGGNGTENLNIPGAVGQLNKRLSHLYQQVFSIQDPAFVDFILPEARSLPGMSSVLARLAQTTQQQTMSLPSIPSMNLIRPLGIGDLKVVKQKLNGYFCGEVAHIENVLKGEAKSRKFRTLDRMEQTYLSETTTTESTEKDSQTTDRFELKKETESTIKEDMSVKAGLTVTASYGPIVATATGDFAYSTSKQDSQKSSSNFAHEVVDRSVSKIEKTVKEQRTTKNLHEVEEINDHSISNVPGTGNISGVYRWVDKHYTAQIYNYGVRLMFEFILPEPAAFYIYSQNHKLANDINLVPPPDLQTEDTLSQMLHLVPTIKTPRTYHATTFKDITESNYQCYVSTYHVQGVTPPPLQFKTISTSIAKDDMPIDANGHAISSKELVVPAGYVSKRGVWWDVSAIWSHFPILEVSIGHNITSRPLFMYVSPGWSPPSAPPFDTRFAYESQLSDISLPKELQDTTNTNDWFGPETPIPISVNAYNVASFTLNAYALVERTDEAYQQWQLQVFEKITAAYDVLKAEYEQKLAQATNQRGVIIQGHNPGINRQVEQTELKKLCITMLTKPFNDGVNTFNADGAYDKLEPPKQDSPPEFNIDTAIANGKFIQFFEQAFEWSQMTYLFYPYFWGKKANWVERSTTYDDDPLFTQFLQAGAARVVVPVPLAYWDAVLLYLQHPCHPIWGGGDVPHIGDSLYLSLAEELRNQTDDLQGATPEGTPWEIVLPTTLVKLQTDPGSSELPTFP